MGIIQGWIFRRMGVAANNLKLGVEGRPEGREHHNGGGGISMRDTARGNYGTKKGWGISIQGCTA